MSLLDVLFTLGVILLATVVSLLLVPVMIWVERRGAGLIQDRLGPNRCNIGGVRLGGLVQSIADVLKFVFKEEYLPAHIKHRFLYLLAPTIVFASAYLTFTVIPLADSITIGGKLYHFQALPVELGVLWILAFAGLGVYGIILAGWSSHNKYGLLGAIRGSAQVISYEASMGLSIITMIVIYGSVHLNHMVAYQGQTVLGVLPAWGFILQPVAAVIFIVTAFAETNRAPFDSAESESEIVAGYHTEYGAMRFALFFVGEYVAMVSSSALIITLFFGGYQIPWLDTETLRTHIVPVSVAVMVLFPVAALAGLRFLKKGSRRVPVVSEANRGKEERFVTGLVWAKILFVEALFGGMLVMGIGDLGAQLLTALLQFSMFMMKLLLMNFVFVWVRWTLPRFRYDQLQGLGWKVLLPLSLLNILVTGVIVAGGA